MDTIYELTKRDVWAFEIFLIKKNFYSMIGGMLGFTLILYWIVSGITGGNRENLSWGIMGLVLICIAFFVVRKRRAGAYGTWEVVLSDEGVRFTPPNRNQIFIPWTNLCGVYQSKMYVYLLITTSTGIVIPRKNLSNEHESLLANKSEACSKVVKSAATYRITRLSRLVILGVLGLLALVSIVNYFTR